MRKRCLLCALCLLFGLAGCQDTGKPDAGVSSLSSGSSAVEDVSSAAAWVKAGEGIFDISAMLRDVASQQVEYAYADEHVLMGYDREAGQFVLTPYDLKTMQLQQDKEFRVTETFGGHGIAVSTDLTDSVFAIKKEDRATHQSTMMLYDYTQKASIQSFSCGSNGFIGTVKEARSILHVDSEEDGTRQTISIRKNSENKGTPLLQWTIKDGTKQPALHNISQGERGFAFAGTIYPSADGPSDMCYGLLDKQGHLQMLKKIDDVDTIFFRGGLMLYDTQAVYGTISTPMGHFEVYHADAMKCYAVTPDSKKEMVNKAQISSHGKYILTSLEDTQAGRCMYKVYDVAANRRIAAFDFALPNSKIVPRAASISEKETAFTLLLTDEEGKPYLYYFDF